MIDASMAVIGLESCSPLQPGTLLLTAGSGLAVADLLEREGRPPCRPILRLVMWGQMISRTTEAVPPMENKPKFFAQIL
jgi:hypothetical protein